MSDFPKSGPLIAGRARIIWPIRPIFRTKNRDRQPLIFRDRNWKFAGNAEVSIRLMHSLKRSIITVHRPTQRFDIATLLLGRQPFSFLVGRNSRFYPLFRLFGRASDQICQPLARNIAISRLAAFFADLDHHRAVFGPSTSGKAFQPAFNIVGQIR